MKLQTALKKAALLKGEIKELSAKLPSANTWTVRKDPRDPAKEMAVDEPKVKATTIVETLRKKKEELCALKGKICIANGSIQHIIASLGEAKDLVAVLKGMSGDNTETIQSRHTRLPDGNFGYVDEVVVTRASIDFAARELLIATQVAKIQEYEAALNNHNFVTEISD